MKRLLPLVGLSLACSQDTDIKALSRELRTASRTFDVGVVAVNERETLTLFPASVGRGELTIRSITTTDPDHWAVSPGWDVSGAGQLVLDGGTEENPDYGFVQVIFIPLEEGPYRTELLIESDATDPPETTEDGWSLHRITLRGIGRNPCGHIWPTFHDFGPRSAGGYFSTEALVENCDGVKITIADVDITGSASFSVETATPDYVLPNLSRPVAFGFVPAGGAPPAAATAAIDTNAPAVAAATITLIGNDCENSARPEWDADNDGWFPCGGDCNDGDPTVHRGAQERADNGIDDDCDGETDEPAEPLTDDADGDGHTRSTDCDDADPLVFPGATERENAIDDDCDLRVDNNTDRSDDDSDGYSEREGDCDDTDRLIAPGVAEIQDEVDNDCDGLIDEGGTTFDDDLDGFPEFVDGEAADCDDDDPWSFPGAFEDCDRRDNDCDGLRDEGPDDAPNGACALPEAD